MRRISTPTAAQDLFGPGKHGFRNGDPANAILATRLQAEWFNALQEEVSTAVEQSGAPLDPVNNGQLSAAIEGVVDRKAPVASQAEAEESVEANANNIKRMTPLRVLQAIKKNLVGATEIIVGMLRVGTQAEVNAGALDNVAITPKKLRWGFSASLTANGYIVFPSWMDGLIFQWGITGSVAGGGGLTVTLPIAFPSAGASLLVTRYEVYTGSNGYGMTGVFASNSQLTLRNGTTSASPISWLAVGY